MFIHSLILLFAGTQSLPACGWFQSVLYVVSSLLLRTACKERCHRQTGGLNKANDMLMNPS